MDEGQKEIQKQFREQQQKYTYYIIALCVAAIGFSIHETMGQPLRCSQIPLGISIFFWGLSVFCGLRFTAYGISTLYANNAYIDILNGKNKKYGTHPEKITAASTGVSKAMESNIEVGAKYAKWQNIGFYIGSVCFIIWHIVEMYTTAKNYK
ncbi:MAG: hypothetical protein ABI388_11760 [Bacteroidia bacterium]